MTPSELLTRVLQTYRLLPSYGGEGSVTIVTGDQRFVQARFTTVFERPSILRFSCVDEDIGAMAVRMDGETAEVDLPSGAKEVHSPRLAVAALAGLSHGASAFIRGLLIPDAVNGRPLTDLEDLSCPQLKETAENRGCVLLPGSRRIPASPGRSEKLIPATLWIDETTYLVRRLVRPRVEPGSQQ